MADVLVDSDIFIDHLRGAIELKPGTHKLHYSVITRAELFAGRNVDGVSVLLAPLREINVNREVAEHAGRLRQASRMRLGDALIAATALEHGLALATRNRRDFEGVRGLRLRSLT